MKFGLSYNTGVYGIDPDQLIAVARHAKDCGFESFYVPEHIALYPGAAVYGMPIEPSVPRRGSRRGRARVHPASTDLSEQRQQMSDFAERLKLG